MTYCVGVQVDEGLVFLSDSRTNAGVDHVSTFRKMTFFEMPGERASCCCRPAISPSASRSPACCASASTAASRAWSPPAPWPTRRAWWATRCATCTGATPMRSSNTASSSTRPSSSAARSAASRRGCSTCIPPATTSKPRADTRYFQIGESKYGKPIIDRVVKADTSLAAVAKCALISMDSTIRSNLSVGMPLDLAIVRRDALQISLHRSIAAGRRLFQSHPRRLGRVVT